VRFMNVICRELTFAFFATVSHKTVTLYDGDVLQRVAVRPVHKARASIHAWVGGAKCLGNYTARRQRSRTVSGWLNLAAFG